LSGKPSFYRFLGLENIFQWKQRGRGGFEYENRPEQPMPRRAGEVLSLDEGRCFGCAACVSICPVDALDLSNLLVIIDEPTCTHCDLCIPACPVHALFFEKNGNQPTIFGVEGH